jgi:hypothetical protein
MTKETGAEHLVDKVLTLAGELPAEAQASLFDAIADLLECHSEQWPADLNQSRFPSSKGVPREGATDKVDNETRDDARRFREAARAARGGKIPEGSERALEQNS